MPVLLSLDLILYEICKKKKRAKFRNGKSYTLIRVIDG